MSLATLKKKTASKYRNNSVNLQQFSINGLYRSQGYIGQGSLGRTILRTPAKGTESQGHGGKDGKFLENDVKTSSINSTESNTYVKSSVLSTSGMLTKRNKWAKRPYPYSITNPSDSNNQSTSGDYTVYKRKNAISDTMACMPDENKSYTEGANCCEKTFKINSLVNEAMSQGDYIFKLISDCAPLDISYVQYNTNLGNPFNTCSS